MSKVQYYRERGIIKCVGRRKRKSWRLKSFEKKLIIECLKAGDKYYEIAEAFNITIERLCLFVAENNRTLGEDILNK